NDIIDEISPKVIGLNNILGSVDQKEIKMIFAFSSIIGYVGMEGNAWYAWGNSVLELILDEFKKKCKEVNICSVAYSIWGDIGMGADLGSVESLSRIGVSPVSKNKGVKAFMSLVEGQLFNGNYIVTSRLGNIDTWNRPIPELPKASRYIENIKYFEPDVEIICEPKLSFDNDLYIKDHMFNDSYLFPTVFGLEAMAQVAFYLNAGDERNLRSFRIKSINLHKPIIVSADKEKEIIITAIKDNDVIKSSIRDIYSNTPSFSAIFEFSAAEYDINAEEIRLPKRALNINPQEDLYGGILFQGRSFQKIKKVYHLSEKDNICLSINEDSKINKPFSEKYSNHLILGDPFIRDSLLQTSKLCVPGKNILPISIENLDFRSESIGGVISYSKLIAEDDSSVTFDIYSQDLKTKNNIEVIRNLKLNKLAGENDPELSYKDLINPSSYHYKKLQSELKTASKVFNISVPDFNLSHEGDLIKLSKEKRHKVESSLLHDLLNKTDVKKRKNNNFSLLWEGDGKPIVRFINQVNGHEEEIHISISHDEQICVITTAKFPHGCDIEIIKNRSKEDWSNILKGYDNIVLDIVKYTSENTANTVLWSCIESAKKAQIMGFKETAKIKLVDNNKSGFLFEIIKEDKIHYILATILSGARPQKRVFSCVVKCRDKSLESNVILNTMPMDDVLPEVFTCKRRGEYGEEIYVHRFRTTFKDANHIDRTLYFPTYANWMGGLRELPLKSISKELNRDMSSGKWGMVTNSSYIKIIGEVKALDLIEGHFFMSKIYGKFNSTVDLVFKWNRVNEDGTFTPVAYSFLPTTWVKVVDHGVVEVHPFPDYFQTWINSAIAKNNNIDYLKFTKECGFLDKFGALILSSNSSVGNRVADAYQTFKTSLNESNLVGNVYYSNYYKWQAEVFDELIYDIDPEFFRVDSNRAKFVCTNVQVQHLREAMPFDKIEVRLYINKIYQNALEIDYEFFNVNCKDSPIKLAWGTQKLIFSKKSEESPEYVVVKIPDKIIESLTKKLKNKNMKKFVSYN
ncbi:MAG: polyketide synthase dehydratase domain-containing protein, partial [Methylophilaceae bacterium]|nr:polyketide synthase dehydratase domain-containing protein [Methylophilaceae bacterium]